MAEMIWSIEISAMKVEIPIGDSITGVFQEIKRSRKVPRIQKDKIKQSSKFRKS